MKRILALVLLASTTILGCVAGGDSAETAAPPDEEVGEAHDAVTASNVICNYVAFSSYCDVTCTTLQADGTASLREYADTPQACSGAPAPRHFRTIYSEALISHWPTFFNGEKGDTTLGAGVAMPPGCEVVYVQGVHYHGTTPITPPTESANDGGHGFTATSTSPATNRLDMSMHWWHDGFSNIKVRAAYVIKEPTGVSCSVAGVTRDSP